MTTSRRSRSGGFRRRAPRQPTTWFNKRINFVQTGAAQSTLTDISHPTISAFSNSGGICKRLIGAITWENASANDDHFDLGVAIAVVTEDALTGSEVPTPLDFSDQDQGFYFWATRSIHLETSSVDAAGSQLTIPIDIRTSRRLRGGYRLVLVAEKGVTVEVSLNVSISLRSLWTVQA